MSRILPGKRRNKQALLERFLAARRRCGDAGAAAGLVGRLVEQKGIDWVLAAMPVLLAENRCALRAAGQRPGGVRAESRAPGQAASGAGIRRDRLRRALAHQIEASADMFLMPSRFEPCGLNQMYSLRYGTPPIVFRTGGLWPTRWSTRTRPRSPMPARPVSSSTAPMSRPFWVPSAVHSNCIASLRNGGDCNRAACASRSTGRKAPTTIFRSIHVNHPGKPMPAKPSHCPPAQVLKPLPSDAAAIRQDFERYQLYQSGPYSWEPAGLYLSGAGLDAARSPESDWMNLCPTRPARQPACLLPVAGVPDWPRPLQPCAEPGTGRRGARDAAEFQPDAGNHRRRRTRCRPRQWRPGAAGRLLHGQLRHAEPAGDGLRHSLRIRHVSPAHSKNGYQKEDTDHWLRDGTPWGSRTIRIHLSRAVWRAHRALSRPGGPSNTCAGSTPTMSLAIPYDMPISAFATTRSTPCGLWKSAATDEFQSR